MILRDALADILFVSYFVYDQVESNDYNVFFRDSNISRASVIRSLPSSLKPTSTKFSLGSQVFEPHDHNVKYFHFFSP
jgi:hypothetical protein